MLRHFTMGLVIDSFNVAAVFKWSDYAPEIHERASADGISCAYGKRSLCYRNFTKDICHAFKLVATVTGSEFSSHKEIQK